MNDKQDFTTGSISGKLAAFMGPVFLALVLQAMYSAVGLLIVGRFGTTAGISGVSTGSSVMNLVTFVTTSLTAAVTIVIGRYIGEGNQKKIGRLVGSASVFFVLYAVVISIILIIAARPLAILMQAPEEAVDLTATYIRICGGGFLFIAFYNFISAIFRGLGDSRMPLVFVGIACFINIVMDYILIAIFSMNVAGAAIATVTAQAVSVVISLIVMKHKNLPFTIEKKDFCFSDEIGKFLSIGFPMALQELLTNISFLCLVSFVNRLGLDASSGYGVAQKIQSFIMLIPSSIMQSLGTFVSQNVGAGQNTRAKKGMLFTMTVGAVVGVVIALTIFLRGDAVSSIFTSDLAVIARSFEYLKGFAVEAVVTSILFSYMGYFNGNSRSLFVMIQSVAQAFLVRLPMSYFMSIQPDASLTHIGMAAPTATCFGIILCTIYYIKMQKEKS